MGSYRVFDENGSLVEGTDDYKTLGMFVPLDLIEKEIDKNHGIDNWATSIGKYTIEHFPSPLKRFLVRITNDEGFKADFISHTDEKLRESDVKADVYRLSNYIGSLSHVKKTYAESWMKSFYLGSAPTWVVNGFKVSLVDLYKPSEKKEDPALRQLVDDEHRDGIKDPVKKALDEGNPWVRQELFKDEGIYVNPETEPVDPKELIEMHNRGDDIVKYTNKKIIAYIVAGIQPVGVEVLDNTPEEEYLDAIWNEVPKDLQGLDITKEILNTGLNDYLSGDQKYISLPNLTVYPIWRGDTVSAKQLREMFNGNRKSRIECMPMFDETHERLLKEVDEKYGDRWNPSQEEFDNHLREDNGDTIGERLARMEAFNNQNNSKEPVYPKEAVEMPCPVCHKKGIDPFLCDRSDCCKIQASKDPEAFIKRAAYEYWANLTPEQLVDMVKEERTAAELDKAVKKWTAETYGKEPYNDYPKHYDNSKGSLYKVAEDRGWNSYQFDIIKRVDRALKKGQFHSDLHKTKNLLDLWLNETNNKNE